MTPTWPVRILTPRNISASPSGTAAKFGGRTLNGAARAVQWSAGGLWRIVYEDIFIDTRQQVLAAQALDAQLDGGATPIIVPRMPGRQRPDGTVLAVPYSDDSYHSDGSGFASTGAEAAVGSGALMSATTLEIIRPIAAAPLIGGEDFSLEVEGQANIPDGPRLHRIARILNIADGEAERAYTVEIRTPLRADVAPGADVNFGDPRGLMRLANYEEFVALLERHKRSIFTAVFLEV